MRKKITFIIILLVVFLTAPAFAGPYPVIFPVEGVISQHQSAITEIFVKRNIDARYLTVGSGFIRFYAGGSSAESVLKLNEVSEVVKELGLTLHPGTWILKAQTIGVLFPAGLIQEKDLDQAIQTFKDAEIKILGTVSMDGQTCKVLQLNTPIDYANFVDHLEKAGIKINDLVWAHWKLGWGVEGGEHDRSENFGAVIKE